MNELVADVKYYNGIITKPFHAECSFDKTFEGLILTMEEEGVLHLPFSELTIKRREKSYLILSIQKSNSRIIEIKDAVFIDAFFHFNKSSSKENWYYRILHAGTAFHILLAASVLSLCAAIYFFIIPFLAEKAVDLIPRSVDDHIGKTVSESPDFTDNEDSTLSVQLNSFLNTMAPELDSRYHITVMNDDLVNAFALPDGSIIINTGILKKMNRFEELAGVLSHEISHVEHRHGMRLLSRNVSGYLLLTLVLNDVNGLMTIFIDNAHQFHTLSYSRKFEKEADLSGLALLRNHNINPQGMIDLFKMLEKEHDIDIPEWMSSHPVSKERIQYLQKQIKEHPVKIKEHHLLKTKFDNIKNIVSE